MLSLLVTGAMQVAIVGIVIGLLLMMVELRQDIWHDMVHAQWTQAGFGLVLFFLSLLTGLAGLLILVPLLPVIR